MNGKGAHLSHPRAREAVTTPMFYCRSCTHERPKCHQLVRNNKPPICCACGARIFMYHNPQLTERPSAC